MRRSVRRELAKIARMNEQFDKDYYQRFYFDSRTAVISRAEMKARANLIAAYANHIGLPVRRMLDAGCGIGLLRTPLTRAFPRAEYTGLEYSEYLCERFGWTQGSLADWSADPFDLTVCYDVLQYLDDRTAARAIANLGRLTRGVLYLSALTARDWRENCDRTRTDRDVFLRDAAWYSHAPAQEFPPERRRLLGAARRAADHLGNGNRRNLTRARYPSARHARTRPSRRCRPRRRPSPRRARRGVRRRAAAARVDSANARSGASCCSSRGSRRACAC